MKPFNHMTPDERTRYRIEQNRKSNMKTKRAKIDDFSRKVHNTKRSGAYEPDLKSTVSILKSYMGGASALSMVTDLSRMGGCSVLVVEDLRLALEKDYKDVCKKHKELNDGKR